MATLQIRDIPDEVYEALIERAQIEHRTVEEQAIVELTRISPSEARRQRMEVIEQLRTMKSPLPPDAPDPVDLIREDRDRAAIEWLRQAEPLLRDEDAFDPAQLVRDDRER